MSGIGSIFPVLFPTWGGTVGPPRPRPDGGGTRALPLGWKGLESPYGVPVPLAYGVAWVDGIVVYAGDTFTYWGDNYINDDSAIRRVMFLRDQNTGITSKVDKLTEAQSSVILLCEGATDVLDILVNGVSVNTETLTTAQRLALICGKNKFTTLAEGVPPAGENVAYFHSGSGSATAHSRLTPPSTRTTAPETYDSVAHIATCALAIGWSEGRPKYQFKVQALLAESATVGAHPADVLKDLWLRAGKPEHLPNGTTHTLDVETYYRAYVTSGGGSGSTAWRVSRAVEDQTSAADLMQALLDETFCTTVTLENGVVRVVPRDAGDTTAYALGVNDFVMEEGSDPVTIERKQASDCYNCVPVKYQIVTASGSHTVTNEDTTFAQAHPFSATETIRRAPAVNAQWISTAEHALNLSALLARESFTVRSVYKFSLHPRWVLLQVGDIVALTEPHLGLASKNCRIVRLSEDSNGLISVEAQEWFGQVAYTTPAVDPFDGFEQTIPGTLPAPEESLYGSYDLDIQWLQSVEATGTLADTQKSQIMALFYRVAADMKEMQDGYDAKYFNPSSPTYDPVLGEMWDIVQEDHGTMPVVVTGLFPDLWNYIIAAVADPATPTSGLGYSGDYAAWVATSCKVYGTRLSSSFGRCIEAIQNVRKAIKASTGGGTDVATLASSETVQAKGSAKSRALSERFGEVLNVLDFGADPTGATDSADAIQAALDAGKVGGRIVFPVGNYRVTDTLTMSGGYGCILDGLAGAMPTSGARITWDGSAGSSVLKLINCRKVTVQNLAILGKTTGKAYACIESHRDVGQASSYVPSGCRFINLWLNEIEAGSDYGIAFTCAAGSDGSNDLSTIQNVQVSKTVEAGLWFAHSQSKAHFISGCDLSDGKYGISTAIGATNTGGSFRSYSCNFNAHSVADVFIGTPNDTVIVSGFQSEGSARLLDTQYMGGAQMAVLLQGGRWADNGLHADGKVVAYKLRGPLIVTGCTFGGTGSVTGNPPYIYMQNSGQASAVVMGNAFNTWGSDAIGGVQAASPTQCTIADLANTYVDDSGEIVQPTIGGPTYTLIPGISATTTAAKNLRGSFSIVGTNVSATVTFPEAEENADYYLSITCTGWTGSYTAGSTRIASVSKAGASFSALVEVAPGTGNATSFDWILVR